MQSENNTDDKNEVQSETKSAVTFKTFKDEIPNLVRERNVSFSKNSNNVTIPLDGPDSESALEISHTVSMILQYFINCCLY